MEICEDFLKVITQKNLWLTIFMSTMYIHLIHHRNDVFITIHLS